MQLAVRYKHLPSSTALKEALWISKNRLFHSSRFPTLTDKHPRKQKRGSNYVYLLMLSYSKFHKQEKEDAEKEPW